MEQSAEAPKAERLQGAGEGPNPVGGGHVALIGIIGFLVALSAGFFIGQIFKSGGDGSGVRLETGTRFKVRLRGDEPARGAAEPLVTVVEFADFQCDFCAKAREPLHQAMQKYPDDVRVIYKHFPLPGHPRATPAAKAAWAAHQQGKFWEMHDHLFDERGRLRKLATEVEQLGIDAAQFSQDMESAAAATAIDEDMYAGARIGVTGTPAFFVNGYRYVGHKSRAQWIEIIEAGILDAKKAMSEGTARADVYAKLLERAKDRRIPAAVRRGGGEPDPEVNYRITVDGRPTLGPDDALVTLVEFSDFQCPYCSRLRPVIDTLLERNPDVRIVFRNLPLPNHGRARMAARAALAADRQGKFWEMHDEFFARQGELPEMDFAELADQLGLDVEQFASDLADPALVQSVEEDEKLAKHFNVNSTPSMFVNGRYMRGAQPVSAYQDVIDEERAKAQALVDAGTPRAEVYDALMNRAAKGVE